MQLIQPGAVGAGVVLIEAEMDEGPAAAFVGSAGDAHQARVIAEVVLQGACDAAAQIRSRRS